MLTNTKAKRTISLEDIVCPKCKIIGQEKYKRVGRRWYIYVDHYKSGGKRIGQKLIHGKYLRCCYIGKLKEW